MGDTRHALGLAALALAMASIVPSASADSKSCVAANDRGNSLRSQGKLRAAKEQFLACAADSCPKVVRAECADLVTKLDAATPSIVVVAVDDKGNDTTAARLYVDDAKIADRLDGRAVTLDPGEHKLRLEGDDGSVEEVAIVAREGEKNRGVRVTLKHPGGEAAAPAVAPTPTPPDGAAAPTQRPIPTLAWVTGALGVAALGSFATFAILGRVQQTDLEDRCAPKCKQEEADAMHLKYIAADISLGVAVVAVGATIVLIATRPSVPVDRAGTRRPHWGRRGLAVSF